jgi:GNAT superfamily N-acetyltransferase
MNAIAIPVEGTRMNIDIRPLQETDLDEADRIFRLAFGTFLGLPDPLAFAGDADFVRPRWRAAPHAALGAYRDGVLVGSNFATHWGRFGFFGPLTVHPDSWDQGIARRLLEATMQLFQRHGTQRIGLFTFPHSVKHIALYQKHGFWPQQLTPVMARPAVAMDAGRWRRYSQLAPEGRLAAQMACIELARAVHPDLDPTAEIEAVSRQQLGDTVLLYDDEATLVAFGICHLGGGSEAGSGAAYVKFGAAKPGARAERHFARLLDACTALAATEGLGQVVAGINTARLAAYRHMLEQGFRTMMQGVAMQSGVDPGHNRADCFVIDDWR